MRSNKQTSGEFSCGSTETGGSNSLNYCPVESILYFAKLVRHASMDLRDLNIVLICGKTGQEER